MDEKDHNEDTRTMTDRTFAERLRARIEEDPNLTPAGLAVKAGLSNSVIRKILKGTTKNPRYDNAQKICKALGTTLEEFMSNAQTPEEHEIVRLISALPADLKKQLLGYGYALEDQARQADPEDPSES